MLLRQNDETAPAPAGMQRCHSRDGNPGAAPAGRAAESRHSSRRRQWLLRQQLLLRQQKIDALGKFLSCCVAFGLLDCLLDLLAQSEQLRR